MSSSIENRIVTMKFDNAEFEKNVGTTLESMDKLKKSLNFSGAGKGLTDLQGSINKFSMHGMEAAVTGVSSKFIALSTIGITALSRLTSAAISAGARFAKSFTVAPITQGLKEYETTLNSIQTIQANTGLTGKKGLQQINGALNDLNHYSDLTIYNFSEMARNIGTFTAAGIKLGPATDAIKGIANLAAVSGSSADQASTAMYQMSQALASGSVKLQDWNSVVNAGMGGKVFQESLKETARNHGVAVDKIIKKEGSFRASLQTGWLSSGILTETLQKFTGDLTKNQLKQMGYTDQEIKGIQKMGKTAQDAATKVKTVSQLINTLQEAAGSGWAQTWTLIFGNFDQAKTLFTNVNNVLSGMINSSAKARNKVLGDWNKLGGRTILIDAISQAFKDLMAIIKPVSKAFHDIFPKKTGQDLVSMTMGFYNLTRALKPSKQTIQNLQRTFRGFFAIFDIAKQVLKGVAGFFVDILKSTGVGGGGILDFTAKVGDLIYAFDQALKKGDVIGKFFDDLAARIKPAVDFLRRVGSYIGSLFDRFDPKPIQLADDAIGRVTDRLSTFQRIGNLIGKAWEVVIKIFAKAGEIVQPLIDGIADAFSGLGDAIAASIQNGNFNAVLDLINTTLLGGIVLLLRRFFKNGLVGVGGSGFVKQVQGIFSTLTGSLKAMQQQIKAKTLLEIAGAIGILTLSVVALSLIDSAALTRALTAMAIGFGQLLASMAILTKIGASKGFLTIPAIATGLILLSTAILILTGAVAILAQLDWTELAKGLGGVSVLLIGLSKTAGIIAKNSKGMITAGAGIAAMAVGIGILAVAVTIFSKLSWEEIGKGLVGVAGALTAVVVAMNLMPPTSVLNGAALIGVGIGLAGIAAAIVIFAHLKWEQIAKGLLTLVGALGGIGVAMGLFPLSTVIIAPALIKIAKGLVILAAALQIMAHMSWTQVAKGLVVLAGSLGILAIALTAMSGTLAGSAALFVAAAGIAVLTPALVALGNMSWVGILKSLVALAGAFILIGVAAVVMSEIIPVIAAFGIALVLVGGGLALAGAGAFLFATAFATIAAVGTAGVSVLVALLAAVISAIPGAIKAFGDGIVLFALTIKKAGPALVDAFYTVLASLLTAITKILPKIGSALNALIGTVINVIVTNVPKLVTAGAKIILSVLKGVRDNIQPIVTVAADIIANFILGIGQNSSKIIDAGFQMIIDFLNGLSAAIDAHSYEMGQAGENLAIALIEGMVKGLAGGVGAIVDEAKSVAGSALGAFKHAFGIHSPSKEMEKIGIFVNQGFIKGLVGSRDQVRAALKDMQDMLHNAIVDSTNEIKQQKETIDHLKKSGKSNTPELRKAEAALKAAENLHKRATAASEEMTKSMKKQKLELDDLGKQYDKVHAKLLTAQQALKDAKQASKDASANVASQFGALPDISNVTQLSTYEEHIKTQTAAIKKFKDSLAQLRKLGLDDATYKELLAQGIDVQPFIDQLLASGKAGIKQLNTLDAGLASASKSLGNQSSKDLYQAGIDAAQGLVDGLEKSQDKITAQMTKIAKAMAKAIKKELGIKSPSKEMIEVGKFVNEGLIKGLQHNNNDVELAATNVADSAVAAIKNTMKQLSGAVSQHVDTNPVITPVLDISDVQKNAATLNKMFKSQTLDIGTSTTQAATIARLREEASKAQITVDPSKLQPVQPITFEQNNYSPKALRPVDIYRQTKNQLSLLTKEAPK